MDPIDIETIEIELLLEAVYRRYGHDFRRYARASIERRIRHYRDASGCERISELLPRLLHDEDCFADFLAHFSIPVTELFRDPAVYLALRRKVLPVLATYPFLKIWHAGCATGEEVYSLAILLEEEGLLERATLYATDFNDAALERARRGVYPVEPMREASRSYQAAGGTGSLTDYYHADYEAVIMDRRLARRITFANHNLVTDSVFTEAHLILCRNVLIYFNRDLQDRVLGLFGDSLVRGGFLCLGSKEGIDLSPHRDLFEPVDAKARIYKKRA